MRLKGMTTKLLTSSRHSGIIVTKLEMPGRRASLQQAQDNRKAVD
jgi:hypothetical protein